MEKSERSHTEKAATSSVRGIDRPSVGEKRSEQCRVSSSRLVREQHWQHFMGEVYRVHL